MNVKVKMNRVGFKSENRILRQKNDTGGFAQIIKQDEIVSNVDDYDDEMGLNDDINEIYHMMDEEMEQEKRRSKK